MNELILIPWLIDKKRFKGLAKKEILKAKYFQHNNKIIVYDFLGYSHSLSILEAFKDKGYIFSKILFFGAASFIGNYNIGDIVFPKTNFIFLRYEDRVSDIVKLNNNTINYIEKNFTKISSDSLTLDYAGFFPLNELSMLKGYDNIFIEMEYGFILRWAIKENIDIIPIYILTDKWGEKVKINDLIKSNFNSIIDKLLHIK